VRSTSTSYSWKKLIGSKARVRSRRDQVSDLDASRRFFEMALAPLGYEIAFESPELVDMRARRSELRLVRRDPVGHRAASHLQHRIARQ
jgi:hypothetical protein